MNVTPAHKILAKKLIFQKSKEDSLVPDSLMDLVTFIYTEEEAETVTALGYIPLSARIIALKLHRPVGEVRPVLESLADRSLITRFSPNGIWVFGFLPITPGLFESQMIRSKDKTEEYYTEFSKRYEAFYKDWLTILKPRLKGKDLRFGRVIPIEKSIEKSPGISVMALPSDSFSEMAERNHSFALLNVCSCRRKEELLGNGCDKPKDVCAAMGRMADFVVGHGLARKVTREEFLEAKMRAAEAGLVNLVDNLENPLQVCSCCGCCCDALRVLKEFNIPTIIIKSHFEANIDIEKCVGCEICEKSCPMDAIILKKTMPEAKKKKASIDPVRCIGCGICVIKCGKHKAATLQPRMDYNPPAKSMAEYSLDRYCEVKGIESPLLHTVGMGISRLLNKYSPLHISGPKYKPDKSH